MGEQRPRLEPIQEESEREDESTGSETGEGEEEEGEEEEEETMEVMAEDESEEDEDAPLRVLRPRRLSRSLSQESSLIQSTDSNREETDELSESDPNTRTVGLSEESAPPQQTRLGNEKMSISGMLKIKVSKWKKNTTAKPPVQKKRNSKAKKKESLAEEPFPRWLVNLMVNIEEATTHQLVVE